MLKAGDIRKARDQYRILDTLVSEAKDWTTISLLGHKILLSDLITFEYRRPL